MNNPRFYFSQFILGIVDAMVILSIYYSMIAKGHYFTGIVCVIIWLFARSYAHEKGKVPYPRDSPEWNTEKIYWKHPNGTTECPHCGSDIIVKGGEFRCSDYPDCIYRGKAVDTNE